VARTTGESQTDAIVHALEDRLARLQGSKTEALLVEQILDIFRRCAALPDLDTRSAAPGGRSARAVTRRV
jgi:antitoxin VapB